MQVAGLVHLEVGLWWGCLHEDDLGHEGGGLMQMISLAGGRSGGDAFVKMILVMRVVS